MKLTLILLFTFLSFSQVRFITWDSIGQKELIKKGENYRTIYGKANPEETQMKYLPTADDSGYYLELVPNKVYYVNRKIINENAVDELKASNKKIQALEKKLKQLESEKERGEDLEEPVLNKKPKQIPEFVDQIKGLTSDTLASSQISSPIEIEKKKSKVLDNIEEYNSNRAKIQLIQNKIQELKNSGGDQSQINSLNDELTQLINRNIELQNENNDLNINIEKLIRENQIKTLQIELEQRKQLLLASFAGFVVLILIVVYFLYSRTKKLNKIIAKEQKRSESLLHNILPIPIATRLKEGEMIADHFDNASVIFIDIVGFTKLSTKLGPDRMVEILNRIFTKFDKIASKYGVEKIKTIGDSYMAAAGVPVKDPGQAVSIAKMALEIKNEMSGFKTNEGIEIKFRIGIETGPVVAGVIGEQKFIYDLWGDTVNVAARMEQFGVIDQIQCTDKMKSELERSEVGFKFEERGIINIKGKGEIRTWFLK